ncbi:thyrotropin-releasing hormone receptor-like [Patiria miniata]|uniref:G-protein coupled receptors family 1 profile domain-containing protein n=1 Tax=Patiria miniata TaxID=46514 RepID=A0A914BA42_PATMI|nr:thyrotropin-releasing hormone receptor-like [Patiria miniata]
MATLGPSLNNCVSTNSSLIVNDTLITVGDEGRLNSIRWFMVVILATGVLGNCSFLLVVARRESMRNVINVYLANLAIADIILLIVSSIPSLTNTAPHSSKIWGCMFMVITTTSYYSSISTVSLLAWDRFRAICKPIKHMAISSIKRSMKLVAAAWCCSLIYSVIVYLERMVTLKGCKLSGVAPLSNSPIESYKTDNFHPSPSLSDVFLVLPFIVCLSLNCWLYARIIHALRNRFAHRMNRPNQQVPEWIRKICQSRVRITRMLALNSLIFFLCNAPRSVTTISGYIHETLGVTRWDADQNIHVLSTVLFVVNSCINPLIYNLTNTKYRQAFREVFMPSCCSSSRPTQRTPRVVHLHILSD